MRRALWVSSVWAVFTLGMLTGSFYMSRCGSNMLGGNLTVGSTLFITWNGIGPTRQNRAQWLSGVHTGMLFYAGEWLAPAAYLFRRPALYGYAAFFTVLRGLAILGEVMRLVESSNWHSCVAILPEWMLLSPLVPLVVYRTLLTDSRFWHGLWDCKEELEETLETGLGPRLSGGSEAALDSAVVLDVAAAIEQIRKSGVKLINFASLKLPALEVLGVGGTARVCKGQFQGKSVALKTMFSERLTQEQVQMFTREANILQQLQHPHVIQVQGVCIAPPALCLVLELCEKVPPRPVPLPNSLVTTKDDTDENLSRIYLVSDSKVTLYTHTRTLTHSLSLVLAVMMRSKKLKTSRSILMLILRFSLAQMSKRAT